MRQKTVAIIHYNTPELTEAAILSIRKHGGRNYRVVVFDNSDTRPFRIQMPGVEVMDNTKGKILNLDAMMEAYPHRDRSIGCAKGCDFGSAKHMMTVQKLWELLPDGFVLMESDVLLKASIDHLWMEDYASVGHNQLHQPQNPFGIGRVCPMLCYMNVPLLTKHGARYFDPERTYGLLAGGRQNRNNWYDTGSVMFEDIVKTKPELRGKHVDIRELLEHFGSGSWRNNNLKAQAEWLKQHRKLWEPEGCKNGKVAVCAIGRLENRYAREWVEHYKQLGVDHIFICDDNRPEDGECFGESLFDYIESGFVSLWAGMKPGTILQKQAYEELYSIASDYEWIGFFDFDELICIEDGRDIHDFLDDYEADVVSLNWMTMTDNGLTRYDERPMAERFTQGTGEDFEINRHVKSFVRSGINGISFNDPHIPNAPALQCENVLHERIEQIPVQPKVIHGVAYIKHYNTKTAEEWATLKMRRLSPCGDEYNLEMKAKNVDYFFSINERTPEKEEILGVKKNAGKAASKREQSQTDLNSAEREQANQGERLGKPRTTKRKTSKSK